MRASNFVLQSSIYLVANNTELDLHNDYNFSSVEYNVTSQAVKLVWLRADGDWVSRDLPNRATLTCCGVTHFESIPGDSSFLQSDRVCLSSFGYCTDEDWGRDQFWVEVIPEPSWAWSFQFQSKQEFRIRGEVASVELEP